MSCGKHTNTEWLPEKPCCDSNVHITRSANTVIPRDKSKRVMSNRERLRQRGLTYKQNLMKNANVENCDCVEKTQEYNNKGYHVQGAVDSGTRMAKLKFDSFNTTNNSTNNPYIENKPIIVVTIKTMKINN